MLSKLFKPVPNPRPCLFSLTSLNQRSMRIDHDYKSWHELKKKSVHSEFFLALVQSHYFSLNLTDRNYDLYDQVRPINWKNPKANVSQMF
jgi:hypothetical protein